MQVCKSYIALDIETTGLSPKKDKIIEIGAYKIKDSEIIGYFESFINPGIELPDHTKELTGIREEEVRNAPYIEEKMEELLDFCEDLPLLGHMIIFDYSFIKKAVISAGYHFEKDGIDTLKLVREFMPTDAKKDLYSACRYYGIPMELHHRALNDALFSHLLYQTILEKCVKEDFILFPKPLIYKVKKELPATKRQKEHLRKLINCHRISKHIDMEHLTKSEASRYADEIIAKYGKLPD